ncbi:LamG domain-containing protein [bacterium]|nr:LamG domain-containing protein [bacterium]
MKTLLLWLIVAGITCSAQAAKIIWVSQEDGPAGIEFIEMLQTEGHEVEVMVVAGAPPTQEQQDTMNAADLVVVSRKVNSGDGGYNTFVWNDTITTPLISHSPYILRTNDTERWQWMDGNGLADSVPSTVEANEPTHKIFEGITLADGLSSEWHFAIDRNTSVSTDPVGKGGTAIATKTGDPEGAIIAAEWETGQVAVGPRMMFMVGAREPTPNEGIGADYGRFNLTDIGQIAYLNSISYYAGPWGESHLWATFAKDLGDVDSAPGGQDVTILVKNLGLDTPVNITNLSFTGAGKDFYSVKSAPDTLAPTEVAEIVITLDTNGETGAFDAELVLENDSTMESIRSRTVAFSARALNFAGPAIHYTLDETEGEEILDVTGNGRHATVGDGVDLTAASLVGGDGTAASFSGGQVSAEFSTMDPLTDFTLTDFSMALWMNAGEGGDDLQTIIAKDDGGTPSFGILRGGGNLQWFVGDSAKYETTDNPVVAGTPLHVVALYSETDNETLTLYLNGVQVAQESGLEPFDDFGESPLVIGSFNGGFNFNGSIDDVQVYDRLLDEEEVVAMFNDPGSFPTGGPPTVDPPSGDNILVNGSFEEPVLDNINTNNLGTVPTGWSQTGADATWNLIRNDGSAYTSGVDNAADGSQIIDLNGIFEIFQTFTLTEASDITFGASFSNRESHNGSDPSTVGIYDATGTTLLSPEVSVDTSADPTPSDVWRSGEATVTGLEPGDYQIRIALNNFNNVDAVFASPVIQTPGAIAWEAVNTNTTTADLIGGPAVTFTPFEYPGGNGEGTFWTGDGGTTGDDILDSVYNSHGWNADGATITLDGLTAGQAYQVQLLGAGDTRDCCNTRNQAADDGMGNVSGDFPRGNSSVIGTFTAAAATQDVMIIAGTDTGVDPGLSGFILADADGTLISAFNVGRTAGDDIVVEVPIAPLAPNDPTLEANLVTWLHSPDANFDEATGVWADSSGKGNDAVPAADLGYTAGVLSSGDLFGLPVSTLKFTADAMDLMIVENTNGGQGLENLTIVTVYKRTMIETNAGLVRPVGFGSFINGDLADNFDLATDPSIRKDNGQIGSGTYTVEHPDDAFLIRIAQMSASGLNEWFNVTGELEHALVDAGVPYITGTDSFYLGDLRVSDGADIGIAEVAVYNSALTESQIMGLAAGVLDGIGNGMTGEGAPEVTGVSRSAAGVSLALPEGTTYDIEYSLDLITWETIASDVTGSYDDTNAVRAGATNGFYRGVVK